MQYKLMRFRWLIASMIIAAPIFVVHSLLLAKSLSVSEAGAGPITIQASPITSFDNRDPTKRRFGALEFRGGLVLTSKNKAFGGISALHMEADGAHFLAITDQGSWLRGRIVYKDDKPTDIADAEMAPLLGQDGKPLPTHGWYDTESLAEQNGQFYVGIERVERIVRFDYRRNGLLARAEPIPVPPDFKTFTYNKSLECLAAPLKDSPLAGDLIVVAEHSLDEAGNLRSFAFQSDQSANRVVRFSVKRSDDFDVSDCVALPPNDLLLLEHRYSPMRGVAMRIRRISLVDIRESALVDGKSLIEADLGYQIDNMEGIAVNRNAHGETIITLVSDDNFSIFQRNLLLQFTLIE